MILINTLDETTDIFLTLDGRDYIASLFIKNDASQKEFILSLGDNISTSTERYDRFRITKADIAELATGYYIYSVREVSTNEVIESGKLYILPAPTENINVLPGMGDQILIVN